MALQQLLCSGTQAFTCMGMGVGPRFHTKKIYFYYGYQNGFTSTANVRNHSA